MAYGKRSTYRRKGRRGNRALSTRRIFNNKSAKAQAAQIYALRKSVNRIARANRPEVKLALSNNTNRIFSLHGSIPTTNATFDMPLIQQGTTDMTRIGNVIKILPLKFNTAMFYEEVINSRLGYPPFSELRTHGAQIRFIAIQAKAAMDVAPPLNDVLRYVSFANDIDSSLMMRMPFKTGITSRFHILKNKVYTLSKDSPCLSTTIKVVPKNRTVMWEDNVLYPKGQIWCFWLASGMVRRTSEDGETTVEDYNNISVTWKAELPYTDA